MTSVVVVALLWAAAAYRIALSVRRGPTLWRTAFTVCVVTVALAATSALYGDQIVDRELGVLNLSLLITRLALIAAAAASSIYLVSLRRDVVPATAVRTRLVGAVALAAVEVLAWSVAPIHTEDLSSSTIAQSSTSGLIFLLVFLLAMVLATAESARFFLSRRARRGDPVRAICASLIGGACALGAVTVVLGAVGAIAHRLRDDDMTAFAELINNLLYVAAVGIALGVLSLLLAPPARDFLRSYVRWRSLRPLWVDLVRLHPEIRLRVAVSGGPVRRLRVRLQRRIVEVSDALRTTPVSVPAHGTVDELARALHSVGGPRMAADVLHEAGDRTGRDDGSNLVALARSYARERGRA